MKTIRQIVKSFFIALVNRRGWYLVHVELVSMNKPFPNPYWLANRALTNMMTDLRYEIGDWEEERQALEEAVAMTRQLELDEAFMPAKRIAVHVWTGIARAMTEEEANEIERGRLEARLKQIDAERRKLRETIKRLQGEAQPFNWKRYKEGEGRS